MGYGVWGIELKCQDNIKKALNFIPHIRYPISHFLFPIFYIPYSFSCLPDYTLTFSRTFRGGRTNNSNVAPAKQRMANP